MFLIIQMQFSLFIITRFFNLAKFKYTHTSIHVLNEQYYLYQLYVFLSILLLQSGDIEVQPGPTNPNQFLSVSHWNLNSLSTSNFIKKDLLIAFNSIHDFDIICLSETYLDSSYAFDDKDLQIDNYTMIIADNPLDI